MKSEIRTTMNGKPVFELPARSVINFKSGFKEKLLCDGPTFSTGTACAFSCSFCYVPAVYRKMLDGFLKETGKRHEDIVIRRANPINILEGQLRERGGKPKFLSPNDTRVIYSSPAVDVAANIELVRETIECCKSILSLTNWQIRLLSKSNLLPKIAQGLDGNCDRADARSKVIYGVSTGTLDNKLASAFEQGCPLVSKRIESLHWLQDNGFRTYGMICPSLPQMDYAKFAREMADAIRWEQCEHVWAEIINVRGESMERTAHALRESGYEWQAEQLEYVAADKYAWELYARETFEAHANIYGDSGKLRFLQYVNINNMIYWGDRERIKKGAVCL